MSRRRRSRSFSRQEGQERTQSSRRLGGKEAPVGRLLEDRSERIGACRAGERAPAGEHLEEHAPERPDVGASIQRLPAPLLGAHVGPGAEHSRRARPVGRVGGRIGVVRLPRVDEKLGEAEVEELHLPGRRESHVRGLEVPVQDPLRVGGLHRARDLDRGGGQGLRHGQGAPGEAVGQRRSLHQLHDQHRPPVGRLLEAEERGDAGMRQRGEGARLGMEAGHAARGAGEGVREGLERHAPLEPRIAPDVNLPHSPSTEERTTSWGRPSSPAGAFRMRR